MLINKTLECLTAAERAELNELYEKQKQTLEEVMFPYLRDLEQLAKEQGAPLQPKRNDPTFDKLYEVLDTYRATTGARKKELLNLAQKRYIDLFAPGVHFINNKENYERLLADTIEVSEAVTKADFEKFKKDRLCKFYQRKLEKNKDKFKAAGDLKEYEIFLCVLFCANVTYEQFEVCKFYDSRTDEDLAAKSISILTKNGIFDKENNPPIEKKTLKKARAIVENDKGELFYNVLNSNITNSVTKINKNNLSTTGKTTVDNKIVNTSTYAITTPKSDTSMILKQYVDNPTPTTFMLFDALLTKFTNSNRDTVEVQLPIEEYQRLRGVRSKRKLVEQVKQDLNKMRYADIKGKTIIPVTKKRKNGKEYTTYEETEYNYAFCQGWEIKKGVLHFLWGQKLYEHFKVCPIMKLPKQLWQVDTQKYPNSYALLRKISELKNVNTLNGRKSVDIISVKTLLDVTNLPTVEELQQKNNRQYDKRIKDKFERDLDSLCDTLIWEYCNPNGKPLTDMQLDNLTYRDFENLNVKIHWHVYPEEEILKSKEKIEKQKAKQERAKRAAIAKLQAKSALKK